MMLETLDVVDELMKQLNEKGKAKDDDGVLHIKFSPHRSLVEIIKESFKYNWTVEQTTQKCNEWQRERIEAEKEVFGAPISREVSEDEVRNARVYLIEKAKERR